ncbi:MAG: hypothetical protein US60_C0001G0062 [Microgenomates group bacterium GW2011_GWC1_37_8]|uniref:Uncharacterized protein n=1 Tax=Candidatus Woesebacteria bacterium GW2011_GWB1_38_8 TaxID=1618570 RepID=A0A0G0LEA8_9BACT|nr:MAG: hypothetical protein US60_C0001G0062 [Microgenomates group bacterium GW2011_GWC1_37_8]KKQ86265.1 MAG: hypothetical protein UT08_C0001G0131 [Candidatus Woesebacteria bacterium GW2011_GWB1_38_8]
MNKITHHLRHYLPLLGIIFAGLVGFWIFSYDMVFQLAIVVAVAASYISWGIIHHHMHNDLNLSVVLEYIAVAVVGLVLVFTLLLGV